MASSKVKVLGIPSIKNTQKYYFLLAAKRLRLKVTELEKLPAMEDGILRERAVLQITDGKRILLTLGATTSKTSYLGMKVAVNKVATNSILRKSGLPTTEQIVIHSENDLALALKKFGKIIIKPANSRAGKGIFSNVESLEKAKSIYKSLKKHYSIIVAERIIVGNEYRLLVINGKVFAVAQYIPPTVTGDGENTIHALIKIENARRLSKGDTHLIKINTALRLNLKASHLTTSSVVEPGVVVILHKAAPISSGGFAIDATKKIHPSNTLIAERAARLMNLDITGIDIITPHIETPMESTGGAIIEMNGGPDFDVHFSVHQGKSRNGAEAVLKDYFNL